MCTHCRPMVIENYYLGLCTRCRPMTIEHLLLSSLKHFANRELNQKLMEAESELDDVRNQKSAGEMGEDTELGKKYTDHL